MYVLFFTYINSLRIPDKGCSRNESCSLNSRSTFLLITLFLNNVIINKKKKPGTNDLLAILFRPFSLIVPKDFGFSIF